METTLKISYIIKEQPQQAAVKGTKSLKDQKRRKERKTRKSRSEGKVVGCSPDPLFPARKWEAVAQGGTMEQGDRPPDASSPRKDKCED